jgi:predicted O-linked N-acetylglucosamine transferase (SPINDLY family)
MDHEQSRQELLERVAQLNIATRAEPARAELQFELGNACLQAGDVARAAHAYAAALRLRPGWLGALANLGVAHARLGHHVEAEAAFREALRRAPDNEPVLSNLAGTLKELGRHAEAAEISRRATEIAPDQPGNWLNLGAALYGLNRLNEAADAYQRALALAPDYALAHYNLGHVLSDQWRLAEAIACFRRAVELDAHYEPAWHALLFTLLYDARETGQSIFAAHQLWGRRFPAAERPPPGAQGPSRRMRVAYVSPDFRAHSCMSFLQPLLLHHDRAIVEVFAYSSTSRPDAHTAWVQGRVDHWRDVRGQGDAAIACQIADDGIDILVDLAGHTRNQPLGVFARRPAPVQVAWLGYPATSGLPQMDFRLTDEHADPPGAADRCHTEKLIRLEGGFLCYGAPTDSPAVNELPALRIGHVTFGSFNNIAKITPEVVRTWAQILAALPGSRLSIKGRILVHETTRARLAEAFAATGIDPARVAMRGWIRRAEDPLAAYHDIDIALDTFPYNGATTTFESLWMGVPVVTMAGERHSGRVGASILSHLDRSQWITSDPDAYVAAALRLATDLSALADVRRTLRPALVASTLMDAPAFARKVEAVFARLLSEAAASART